MPQRNRPGLPWVALVLLFGAGVSGAEVVRVGPGGAALESAIAAAAAGDVIELEAGEYRGRFVIDKPLTLRGTGGAVLDAENSGDALRIRAEDVTVTGLIIRNAGRDLTAMNAGILAEKTAARLRVEDNRIETGGFGIWIDGSADARVIGNRISGEPEIRSQDRGNGIHLFAVSGAEVVGNEIRQARDGIYIDTSNGNVLRDNVIHDLRYGIHYMYSHDNRVENNRTYRTRTGYALMQSKRLQVRGNRSHQDRNYGILMNFITDSVIADNRVEDVRTGTSPGGEGEIGGAEGKALFVYNSLFNAVHGNLFARSDIGIHLTAGSEENRVWNNAFVRNQTQVKYVATREQEWSHEGRGNYWSDYLGWDRNADGVGDRPYEPNDAVDKLLWRFPTARVLLNSPAIDTLRWVQQYFPVIRPQGVRDSAPLMRPPVLPEGAS